MEICFVGEGRWLWDRLVTQRGKGIIGRSCYLLSGLGNVSFSPLPSDYSAVNSQTDLVTPC